jgi:hypothetical protein
MKEDEGRTREKESGVGKGGGSAIGRKERKGKERKGKEGKGRTEGKEGWKERKEGYYIRKKGGGRSRKDTINKKQ